VLVKFFKVNIDLIKNFQHTIYAQIGPDNWYTLCALAAFMNSERQCYPSNSTLATIMGVSESTVSRRLRKLANTYVNGKPLITIERVRNPDGTWDKNVYTINTDIVSIFS
jgi:hypothetical protein